jgi:nucleoside phosphorylase
MNLTTDQKNILLTAATRWEATPLAKGLRLNISPSKTSGQIHRHTISLVKTGIGAVRTSEILENAFVAGDYSMIISTGLCGAMQPGLKTGDLVADVSELEIDSVNLLRQTALSLGLTLHFGKILHTNVVLAPQAKQRLGQEYRTLACDMETAAVRRWAGKSAPVMGLRVVLDEMDEEIPFDAPEENFISIARFAAAHTAQLPGLVRLGWRSGRAMNNLTRLIKAYLEAL